MADQNGQLHFEAVPLFPLPNVVLFPRAVLPLHIFEQRYLAMTTDALDGQKLIAMALLMPGWERDYYSRPAIEPVVCIGRILTHEQLSDGKFNFLLQGMTRAKIVHEIADKLPYRTAELETIAETDVMEIDLTEQRQRLTSIFSERFPPSMALIGQFRQMLASPLPTADIADLIAFNLFESAPLKQELLDDADVVHRVDRVIEALEQLRPEIPAILTHSDRTILN